MTRPILDNPTAESPIDRLSGCIRGGLRLEVSRAGGRTRGGPSSRPDTFRTNSTGCFHLDQLPVGIKGQGRVDLALSPLDNNGLARRNPLSILGGDLQRVVGNRESEVAIL